MIKYPEVKWGEISEDNDRQTMFTSDNNHGDVRYCWNGASRGRWIAMINFRPLKEGASFKTFGNIDAAKEAVERAYREKIDAIVEKARKDLKTYTNEDNEELVLKTKTLLKKVDELSDPNYHYNQEKIAAFEAMRSEEEDGKIIPD